MLNDTIPDSLLYIPGYQLLRWNRKFLNFLGKIKKGGGICCYVKTMLHHTNIEVCNLNWSTEDGEIFNILFDLPHIKKCIVINIYRPPSGNIETFLDKITDNITVLKTTYPKAEMLLMGDFYLHIKLKNTTDAEHVKWLEQATGLKQHIQGTTRFSNNDSCIDLIFTNMCNNFNVKILDINISDHQFIYLNSKHCPKISKKIEFTGRSYTNYQKERFCDQLLQRDWDIMYNMNDVNHAWDLMLLYITQCHHLGL